MTKRKKIIFGSCLTLLFLALVGGLLAVLTYRKLDAGYQAAMDPIRIEHADAIAALVMEYAEKAKSLPFEEEATKAPFMVLIGHSTAHEDFFAAEEVMKRGATVANSNVFEAELERVLGREITLPRDPQRVATFAPNVYVYFLSEGQFSVVAHLFEPSEKSVKYEWKGGTFHSHTLSYSRN